jgi:hypothetical protein
MEYFKRLWTYLDLLLITFSSATIVSWIFRLGESVFVLSCLSSGSNNVNLQTLAFWDETLICFLAVCACLTTFKCLEMLKYNQFVQRFSRGFRLGFKKFTGFAFLFFLSFFIWLQPLYVIFNDRVRGFSTFTKTFQTGLVIMFGNVKLNELLQINGFWTVIYIVSFVIYLACMLRFVFLAIVIDTVNELKLIEDIDAKRMDDFLGRKFDLIREWVRMRLFAKRVDLARAEHETMMKESMARKSLYQETADLFVSKTDQMIHKYAQFNLIRRKDDEIQMWVLFV